MLSIYNNVEPGMLPAATALAVATATTATLGRPSGISVKGARVGGLTCQLRNLPLHTARAQKAAR